MTVTVFGERAARFFYQEAADALVAALWAGGLGGASVDNDGVCPIGKGAPILASREHELVAFARCFAGDRGEVRARIGLGKRHSN